MASSLVRKGIAISLFVKRKIPRNPYPALLAALFIGLTCGIVVALIQLRMKAKGVTIEAQLVRTAFADGSRTESATQALPRNDLDTTSSYEIQRLARAFPDAFAAVERRLERELLLRTVDELMASRPRAAAELLGSVDPALRHGVYRSIAIEWGRRSPEAALQWFQENGTALTSQELNSALVGVWTSYAKQNPQDASERFGELSSESPSEGFYAALAEGWSRIDPEAGLHWLAALDEQDVDPALINGAYATLMRSFVAVDAQAASHLVGSLKDPGLRRELLPEVASRLALRDWTAANRWLKDLGNEPAAVPSLSALLSALGPNDAPRAFDVLLSFDDLLQDERNLPVDALARIARHEPDLVMRRLGELPTACQSFLLQELAASTFPHDAP